MFVEPLENRRLLSVDLKGSSLLITGTPGPDQIAVALITTTLKNGKPAKRIQVIEASFSTGESNQKLFKPSRVGSVKIFGQGGNDVLEVVVKNKACTLNGGAGDDALRGSNLADLIVGGSGNDNLTGGGGNDLLKGNGGNDGLIGDAGHDTLIGAAGQDSFEAGAGNDIIKAADGSFDGAYFGGTGNDICELDSKDYSPLNPPENGEGDIEQYILS